MNNYQFDMTKLTIGDYVDMLPPAQPQTIIKVARKCSLIDVADMPITELSAFVEDFTKALTDYVSTQFPPIT